MVAKISRWCRPWRGLRMNAPCNWRRTSSEGSAPSWSIASIQRRAIRARKSGSCSTAVRGQGVFHPGGRVRVAQWPDPVQGLGDDGRGPGRDGPGGHGGGEFLVQGREGLAGDPGARQHVPGQGQPAVGFGGGDLQPVPQEVPGLAVAVIQDRGVRGGGFLAGAVHRARGDELQVLQRPGDLLDPGGELRRLREPEQRRVPRPPSRTTPAPAQGCCPATEPRAQYHRPGWPEKR